MLQEFGDWTANRTFSNDLSDLSNATLGIDASFFLDRHLIAHGLNEPLIAATGGVPLSLRRHVANELAILRSHNIRPFFVFSGLQQGNTHDPFTRADSVSRKADKAWETYNAADPVTAVNEFGASGPSDELRRKTVEAAYQAIGYATPERYTSYFQSILLDADVKFQVAPHSAHAQLAILTTDFVDAVVGSTDLLLYDIERIITSIDFEKQEFTFVVRKECMEELGGISPETFVDACMLAGCSLLPALPTLTSPNPRMRSPKVRAIVDMMRANNQTGYAICHGFQDDPALKRQDYIDRYKRARITVKHPIVLTKDGRVEPWEKESLPNDLHDVIGQRLPDELYFYVSRAVINPSILNKLALRQIHETCPVDGGDAEVYRHLVSAGLLPIRVRALQLMAKPLFRSYIHSKINLTCWFSADKSVELSLAEESDDVQALIDRWVVPQSISEQSTVLKESSPTLRDAVIALDDADFAAKTVGNKQLRLKSTQEVQLNTYWRFLEVRGYLRDDHTLSSWGKVLFTILSKVPEKQEDAGLLAVELLRQNLLRSDVMFPSYTGQPQIAKETDKKICMLLSRVACLLSINQKDDGFHGPLSRHLLGFGSVVDVLRAALRELFEASLASLLLNGHVSRIGRTDYPQLGLGLPLLSAIDVGLGLLVKHYFEDVMSHNDPASAESKAKAHRRATTELFTRCLDYEGELKRAFGLWDAVYAGVKVGIAEKVINSDEMWESTNAWVQAHR